VLLSEREPTNLEVRQPERPSVARVVAYEPEYIAIEAEAAAAGWLVVGEWDYPGWYATVDDRRVPIHRANYGLRAVPLPAGSHRVEFRYRPPVFIVSAAVSAATCGALVVMGWLHARGRWLSARRTGGAP